MAAFVPDTGSFSGSAGNIISYALDDQQNYSVTDNGTEYAVVWSQNYDGTFHILGARFSHSGTLLDSLAGLYHDLSGRRAHSAVYRLERLVLSARLERLSLPRIPNCLPTRAPISRARF